MFWSVGTAKAGVPRKIRRTTAELAPFPRLYHFPDFAPDQVALEGGDVKDVQLPIQVIGFMQKSAGKQVFAGLLERLTLGIVRAHRDALAAGDFFAKSRNAEAAL